MRIRGLLVIVCLFGISAVSAQEQGGGAAGQPTAEVVSAPQEPENVVGTPDEKGKMDYGSPMVEQKLAADHVFLVKYYSKDKEYGYTIEKPVMVGGSIMSGPKNEQRFLNALAGPNLERVTYKRLGSGWHFTTKNGIGGKTSDGLLDKYEVTYEGLSEPVFIYINMYDSDTLKIPVGFRKKYAPDSLPPAPEEVE